MTDRANVERRSSDTSLAKTFLPVLSSVMATGIVSFVGYLFFIEDEFKSAKQDIAIIMYDNKRKDERTERYYALFKENQSIQKEILIQLAANNSWRIFVDQNIKRLHDSSMDQYNAEDAARDRAIDERDHMLLAQSIDNLAAIVASVETKVTAIEGR